MWHSNSNEVYHFHFSGPMGQSHIVYPLPRKKVSPIFTPLHTEWQPTRKPWLIRGDPLQIKGNFASMRSTKSSYQPPEIPTSVVFAENTPATCSTVCDDMCLFHQPCYPVWQEAFNIVPTLCTWPNLMGDRSAMKKGFHLFLPVWWGAGNYLNCWYGAWCKQTCFVSCTCTWFACEYFLLYELKLRRKIKSFVKMGLEYWIIEPNWERIARCLVD